MTPQVFRSKIGLVFWMDYPVIALLGLVTYWSGGRWLAALLVAVGVTVLKVWMMRATRYVITDQTLQVGCGPIYRRAIPLRQIERVRGTTSLMAGPALSLDRLEIAGAHGSVLVSPRDPQAFLAALLRRAPQVRVEGVRLAGKAAG
ncbi:MAG: PH domain-containing protein [Vicinamibacterales bacterium]